MWWWIKWCAFLPVFYATLFSTTLSYFKFTKRHIALLVLLSSSVLNSYNHLSVAHITGESAYTAFSLPSNKLLLVSAQYTYSYMYLFTTTTYVNRKEDFWELFSVIIKLQVRFDFISLGSLKEGCSSRRIKKILHRE